MPKGINFSMRYSVVHHGQHFTHCDHVNVRLHGHRNKADIHSSNIYLELTPTSIQKIFDGIRGDKRAHPAQWSKSL